MYSNLTINALNYSIKIFRHLTLFHATAIHNFKWLNIIWICEIGVIYQWQKIYCSQHKCSLAIFLFEKVHFYHRDVRGGMVDGDILPSICPHFLRFHDFLGWGNQCHSRAPVAPIKKTNSVISSTINKQNTFYW